MHKVLLYVVFLDKRYATYHGTMEDFQDNGSEYQFVVISVKAHVNFSTRFNYCYAVTLL